MNEMHEGYFCSMTTKVNTIAACPLLEHIQHQSYYLINKHTYTDVPTFSKIRRVIDRDKRPLERPSYVQTDNICLHLKIFGSGSSAYHHLGSLHTHTYVCESAEYPIIIIVTSYIQIFEWHIHQPGALYSPTTNDPKHHSQKNLPAYLQGKK